MTYKPEYSKIASDVNNVKKSFWKSWKDCTNISKAKVKK